MKKLKLLICAVLIASLVFSLCACAEKEQPQEATATEQPQAGAEQPQESPAALSIAPDGAIEVSTVDELLEAIAPDATIVLASGAYDLSKASSYGKELDGYCTWVEAYDGMELQIKAVDNLTLIANGEVSILAVPRYANVLVFDNCNSLSLSGLTLGHSEAKGECSGGVLSLRYCVDASVDACKLFGCGILGIDAMHCRALRVTNSEIYDCSVGAASIQSSVDVLFDGLDVHDCEGYSLFDIYSSYNCAIINSEIHDNVSASFVQSSGRDVYLGSVNVINNRFTESMFVCTYPICLDGCYLLDNVCTFWYGTSWSQEPSAHCVDASGAELDEKGLSDMRLGDKASWNPKPETPLVPADSLETSSDGYVHVSNVDELLAAIAPNTKIFLEDGDYLLSDASNYGGYIGDYYHWAEEFDGAGLIISNVENLTIAGGDLSRVNILAVPRYADVLCFENCEGLTLSGFTAGHTQGSSGCVGNVIGLNSCVNLHMEGLGLFGCGVVGICANRCEAMEIRSCNVYDCSSYAVQIFECDNADFYDCMIYNNGYNALFIEDSRGVRYNEADLPVSDIVEIAPDGNLA